MSKFKLMDLLVALTAINFILINAIPIAGLQYFIVIINISIGLLFNYLGVIKDHNLYIVLIYYFIVYCMYIYIH